MARPIGRDHGANRITGDRNTAPTVDSRKYSGGNGKFGYGNRRTIRIQGKTGSRLGGQIRLLPRFGGRRALFDGLDILIAAAGMQGPIGPFLASKPKLWNETVETNLIGVANACRVALPAMIEKRSGKIILIAGGGSAYSRPYFTAYAASKSAVVRFGECLADEVREHNVQVNTIAPGGAYTTMTDEILRAGEDRAGRKEIEDAEKVRITGGVAPEKQPQLAIFLASQKSNHISGKLIHVNDDWKRMRDSNMHPEAYTLRRVLKV